MRLPDRLVAACVEPAWDLWETRGRRLATWRRLRRLQWDPPAAVDARRRAALAAIVRHAAATTPFYAARFAAAGIDPSAVRDIADLARLPVLAKEELREQGEALFSRAVLREDLVSARTGGSTGVALQVWCDRAGVDRRAGAALLADNWSGWRIGQPVAAVWGNPPLTRTARQRLRAWARERILFLDTMRIDAAAIAAFAAGWRRLRPGLLFGHAHSLFILAEALEGRGLTPAPRGIVATSMMLLRPEREVIERVCGVPVTNRYGCEELGLIACECERHDGMHLSAETVWVEALRDDGTPCAPGEDGRLVITDLVNRGQPLLRYEVGDRGALAPDPCRCGRGWPRLAALSGRSADFLLALDGSRVAGISLIENTLTRLPGIRQLQLVQEERGVVVANLVPAVGWSEITARALAAALRAALGAGLGVEIRLAGRIAPEPSGKYRFSICRIPS
ncbi:MAG: phenylacetate--CoA ligase family protein [Candidatus Krumholzibacteriia bacterium]